MINLPNEFILNKEKENDDYILTKGDSRKIYHEIYRFHNVYNFKTLDFYEETNKFVAVTCDNDKLSHLRIITTNGKVYEEKTGKNIYPIGSKSGLYQIDTVYGTTILYNIYSDYNINLLGDLDEVFYRNISSFFQKMTLYVSDDEGKNNYANIEITIPYNTLHCAMSLKKDTLGKMYPFVISEKDNLFITLGEPNQLLFTYEFAKQFSSTDLANQLVSDYLKNKSNAEKRKSKALEMLKNEMINYSK